MSGRHCQTQNRLAPREHQHHWTTETEHSAAADQLPCSCSWTETPVKLYCSPATQSAAAAIRQTTQIQVTGSSWPLPNSKNRWYKIQTCLQSHALGHYSAGLQNVKLQCRTGSLRVTTAVHAMNAATAAGTWEYIAPANGKLQPLKHALQRQLN